MTTPESDLAGLPVGSGPARAAGQPTGSRGSGVPAARAGRCECCGTAYPAGTVVVWDSVGLVLDRHRSVSSRR